MQHLLILMLMTKEFYYPNEASSDQLNSHESSSRTHLHTVCFVIQAHAQVIFTESYWISNNSLYTESPNEIGDHQRAQTSEVGIE